MAANAGVRQKNVRVVVIGAGMSGVLMGIRLRQAGFSDFTIYEKGTSVGGTWRENNYPGLACDVPSQHYTYSFDKNPDWSSRFSRGAEIREYLERAAIKFGIIPHIQFNSTVTDGRWEGGKWHLKFSDGAKTTADILISATGFLHRARLPEIPGRESFAGAAFHTTRWDHSIPLADKRIGVIGTGSTAVQIVAELGGKVRRLIMFQRTAQWVARSPNPKFSDKARQRYRRYPFLLDWAFRRHEQLLEILVLGGIMGFDRDVRAALIKNCQDNLATVKDPELRRKLTPNYEVGCKRLVSSPSFYEAIQQSNSELVTEKIQRIVPEGMITADGRLHPLDIIAFATGFDPLAYMRPIKLIGEGGRTIDEVWSPRPVAYHGIGVPHMPNFFLMAGPYSPTGNLSIIAVSELQADYIMRCLEIILARGVSMSPTAAATATQMERIRAGGRETIWATGGCQSWYLDDEGVPIMYPFKPAQFKSDLQAEPQLSDYELRHLAHAAG